MKWDSNSILICQNEKDFIDAINAAINHYDKELKHLFGKYNKISTMNYGKHIRAVVHKLEFDDAKFRESINKTDFSVENKQKVIELLNKKFNKIESIEKSIDEVQILKNDSKAEDKIDATLGKVSELQGVLNELNSKGDELNQELYLNFESHVKGLINEVNLSVRKGLNEISGYKSEMELGKNYKEMIELQLNNSTFNVKIYFISFIFSLITLVAALLIPSYINALSELAYQIGVRISLGLPLLWFTSFIFTHYKFYKVSQLKYQHILNLLGGGAYYIGELLDDKAAKEDANSRIIEMLLDYKDLSNLFYKEKEPIDKYLKKALEILKESKELFKENTTHNK